MRMDDYQIEALRTVTPNFYGEKLSALILLNLVDQVEGVTELVDDAKKMLFYGREPKKLGPVYNVQSDDYTYDRLNKDLLHAALGMVTESVELLCELRNAIDLDTPPDRAKVYSEMGDILWYLALALHAQGISFEQLAMSNIAKLRARYPDQFTLDLAVNKDEDNENKNLMSVI